MTSSSFEKLVEGMLGTKTFTKGISAQTSQSVQLKSRTQYPYAQQVMVCAGAEITELGPRATAVFGTADTFRIEGDRLGPFLLMFNPEQYFGHATPLCGTNRFSHPPPPAAAGP